MRDFLFRIALEENENAAVLLLETLPKQNFIYVHVFLLLAHHLESHTFRIQIVSISLESSLSCWKVELMSYLLVALSCPHFL